MGSSSPKPASHNDGDRATTPGVGDDSRATLPEPQPPAGTNPEFNRTVPMGSAAAAEWIAQQVNVSPEVTPVTKSDRVPVNRSRQQTLHSYGSGPPPKIETDDKRWIGGNVEQNFNTTQRAFTAIPPQAAVPNVQAAPSPTLRQAPPQSATINLASTMRGMSVPPPTGSAPPKHAPAIQPMPTIKISPEIAVGAPVSEPQARAPTWTDPAARALPAQPPPLPHTRQVAPREPAQPTAAKRSPLLLGAKLKTFFSDWSTGRVLLAMAGATGMAILGIILATTPSQITAATPDPAAAHTVAPAPFDARPSTKIITSPTGAEIILRGALVANSPAPVPRPAYESLYLVRLHGYQPQLVSLSPSSPVEIHITLQPLVGAVAELPEVPSLEAQPEAQSANAQNQETAK